NILEGAPAVTPSSSASKSPSSDTDVPGSETSLDTFDSDFDDTYIAPETTLAASSSSHITINVTLNNPISHVQKWTKDHSLENMIGDSQRPVSTRRQLKTDAMWCFFNEFLSHVEPKNYKQALEHFCWIKAMQEEIHEFERLDVWVLVPSPDNIFIIPLKWIFKIKLDEYGDVLKNKSAISQNPRGIFICQAKYALKILKKHGFDTSTPIDTPMLERPDLDEDIGGKMVDPTRYRGMVGCLMYLTASRPDIVFGVCMCARYQAKPTEKHLHAIKRIF
nr:uncharacterized mitochondrial protein AtMg00810-like [Tanacetum cinerariifolium]